MKQWFKLTDSAVMSLKWQRIARKLGVSPAVVSFVFMAAMSSASQCNDRGSLQDFDPEDVDFFGDFEDGTTSRVMDALTEAGFIEDGRIAGWEESQNRPSQEEADRARLQAAERKRRQRAREQKEDDAEEAAVTPVSHDVTPCPTMSQPVTSCPTMSHDVTHTDQIRSDQNRSEDLKHTPLTPQGETQGVGVSTPAQTSSPLKARETPRPDQDPKPDPKPKPEPPAEDPPQAPDTSTAPQVDTSHGNPAWKEFCYLYSLWPNQQGKEKAWREYAYLRARHLVPESYALAEVIDRFKTEDRRWKRGYVPMMANWLRDRRWDDVPEKAPARSYAPDENGRTPYVNENDQDYSGPSKFCGLTELI